jgi:hypothetical protein
MQLGVCAPRCAHTVGDENRSPATFFCADSGPVGRTARIAPSLGGFAGREPQAARVELPIIAAGIDATVLNGRRS